MTALRRRAGWEIGLMGIGAAALGTAVLKLFSSLGSRPESASQVGGCIVGSEEFLHALAGVINSPLGEGGSARLHNNGDEFYPAMLKAIGEAEHSVNFTTYIWKGGRVSDLFFDALTEKAAEGVSVRVLIDALGGIAVPSDRVDEFRAAGGRWEWFHRPKFGTLTRMHRRTHRRALVVDGRIGFTGGAAVMDKWLGSAENADQWRDCMVETRGKLTVSLQAAFTQLWAQSTGEILGGDEFYPREVEDGRRSGGFVSRHINIISSPSAEAHPMRQVFWFSIRSATERVFITNPYFVPDGLLREVLKYRAGAGVDVRVLVPNEHNDVGLVRWASHSYYEELLEAGVRIYEYQPTMIHQKIAVIDGKWSLVGSANMDVRSKELNQENALGLLDEEFAAELERTFFADLERAREIHLDDWRRRSVWRRPPERFFRLFEEQF